VWEAIDNHMDSRRRDRREKRLEEELKKFRTENPKITEQFADLKRKLADIADEEWEVDSFLHGFVSVSPMHRFTHVHVLDLLLVGTSILTMKSILRID
jgi:hypothetical protein